MRRFASISSTTLVCGLLGSGCASSLYTAPVFLSQPDAHALTCMMANVSQENIFNVRIEIQETSGDVIASRSQDVLLAGETAVPLTASTVNPFIASLTLRCSFHFDGPRNRVRATGCLADSADSFGALCRAALVAQ
jgi:hypothetical protein